MSKLGESALVPIVHSITMWPWFVFTSFFVNVFVMYTFWLLEVEVLTGVSFNNSPELWHTCFVVFLSLHYLQCWSYFTVVLKFVFLQALDTPPKLQERDFVGTPYVPVYVMLPVSCIDFLFVWHLFYLESCSS